MSLYNSSSKLQSIFGIDDPNELQSAKNTIVSHKKRRISNKRRSSSRKSRMKRRSSSKKSTKRTRSSLFRAFRISVNTPDSTRTTKMRWRPSLRLIYDDAVVLEALTEYTQRSFNAENVLFLRAVRALLDVDAAHIDDAIITIYDSFIGLSAISSINLSSECLMHILWLRSQFSSYDLSAKRALFEVCVSEIEFLMLSSVLPAFYESPELAAAAPKSEHFASFRAHRKNSKLRRKYESLDVESPLSMSSLSPTSPPIKLEVSHSAATFFVFESPWTELCGASVEAP